NIRPGLAHKYPPTPDARQERCTNGDDVVSVFFRGAHRRTRFQVYRWSESGGIVRAATTVILFIGSAVASLWPTFLAPTKVGTEAPQQTSLPPGTSLRLRDEIKPLEQLLARASDRGAALFLLAHDYARLGGQAKALDLLKECIPLDAG